MIDLGHFALILALVLSLYATVIGALGAIRNNTRIINSASNALLLLCVLTILSVISLAILFLKHDFRYSYVWQNSNREMHPLYLVSAVWGGMDGSMLLWAAMLCVFTIAALINLQLFSRRLVAWFVPVSASSIGFFLFVITFFTNPFRLIPSSVIPQDGRGLNPLLQDPSMMIHPPMLYAGFCGFIIPFAFCLAALLSGELNDNWIRLTRRATLIAWGFLTLGIILGGHWAYIELGWGGYWAWDPVENASFLPWLSATAYIHSVMVQQRRGMLKAWNVSLCLLTYLLTVFGTFLTRSGVVQSVHAFAETDVGWIFLLYIFIVVIFCIALIAYRWKELRSERRIESFVSREAVFLFNNLLLLSICFAVFWGVMFPVFSEAITGTQSVVGPPYFNKVTVPLFLALLFFMGIGPLIAWRQASLRRVFKVFLIPFTLASLLTLLFLYLDVQRPLAALSFGVSTFVILTVFSEFHRAIKAKKQIGGEAKPRPYSLFKLLIQHPQKYAGLIVHLGAACMAISITASSVYKIEQDFSLAIGESFTLGIYQLELESVLEGDNGNYIWLATRVLVKDKAGEKLAVLTPERRFYKSSEQDTTEVAIRTTARDDLYLAFAGMDQALGEQRATFKGFVNPLQMWLWVSAGVVLFGTLCLIGFPAYQRELASSMVSRSAAEVKA